MNQFLLQLIEHLKYLGIFLGAFIEGPATALAGGFLVKSKFISFVPTLIAHFMGDFLADMTYFSIGRLGSKKILHWVERLFHFSDKEIQEARKGINKHYMKIIFVGKLTHFLGLPAIISIGLSEYSWKKFFVFNLFATIIKSSLLVALGYGVGSLWQQQESAISRVGIIVLVVAILFVIYYYIKRRYGEKKI